MGRGWDTFYIEGGQITSPVNMGDGDDWAAVTGGTLSSNFAAGPVRTNSFGPAANEFRPRNAIARYRLAPDVLQHGGDRLNHVVISEGQG
jgi:hypothetical protein